MMAAQETGPEYRTGAAVAANGGAVLQRLADQLGLYLALHPAKTGALERAEANYRLTRLLCQRDMLAELSRCVAVLHALPQRVPRSVGRFHAG